MKTKRNIAQCQLSGRNKSVAEFLAKARCLDRLNPVAHTCSTSITHTWCSRSSCNYTSSKHARNYVRIPALSLFFERRASHAVLCYMLRKSVDPLNACIFAKQRISCSPVLEEQCDRCTSSEEISGSTFMITQKIGW